MSHMDDANLQDLKQYLTAALSQQSVEFHAQMGQLRLEINDLRTSITDEIRQSVMDSQRYLETKIDDLSAAVAEAIEVSNDTAGEQLTGHERRITRLEKSAG
jgi:uncharacterized protein involved in exopolysaccharide biosynthesis